jgi:hypothetical protein
VGPKGAQICPPLPQGICASHLSLSLSLSLVLSVSTQRQGSFKFTMSSSDYISPVDGLLSHPIPAADDVASSGAPAQTSEGVATEDSPSDGHHPSAPPPSDPDFTSRQEARLAELDRLLERRQAGTRGEGRHGSSSVAETRTSSWSLHDRDATAILVGVPLTFLTLYALGALTPELCLKHLPSPTGTASHVGMVHKTCARPKGPTDCLAWFEVHNPDSESQHLNVSEPTRAEPDM